MGSRNREPQQLLEDETRADDAVDGENVASMTVTNDNIGVLSVVQAIIRVDQLPLPSRYVKGLRRWNEMQRSLLRGWSSMQPRLASRFPA